MCIYEKSIQNSTMKILLIPFLVLCVVRISKSECPPEEEIRPCVCSQSSNPITVKCSRIINQETLVKVFTKSFDFPMQSLILQDSSIPYVPSKVPESKKLGSLSIINCSMSSVFEQPPKSPHLVSLTLANITLQRGIDWEILSGLQPQVIHIEGVHVKKIKPSFTKHLSPALKKFKLINTRTVSFSENAFAKFNNLEELVCAHGSIRTITRSMLPTTCKLSLLDLTANEIDELPDGLFSNCHKLAKVLLAYNQLRHFTAAVWQEVWDHALLEVTLEGNPLKCDCSTKWFMSRKKNVQLIGKCTEPSTFAGKTLRGLVAKDFTYCPRSPAHYLLGQP